jgi:hypothetical protein
VTQPNSTALKSRSIPPRTLVTVRVAIDHPEWVGDGQDEAIALDFLKEVLFRDTLTYRIVEVETVPGERV